MIHRTGQGVTFIVNTSEKIWQAYQSGLRRFVKSRIPDDSAVDDILQDVFLKMHTGLDSLRDESKLQSWIYQIARNAVIDHYRSLRPAEEVPEWLPQPEPDQGEQALQELSHCLQPMVQMLPESYREAVILSELKGLTQKEVAQAQGISLSGAKSRVQRGRVMLRNMLTAYCRPEFDGGGRISGFDPHPDCRSGSR